METMRQRGLVILSTPDKPLFLNTSWSNKKLNAKFKQLLPGPIGFCEKHPYAGDTDASPEIREQVWMGCIKQGRNLSIAGDVLPTGVEIADHCKIPGRSPSDRVVYLVSKVRIPKPRWSWEEQSDSEDLGSDIETVPSEDLVRTPRKPLRKGKGKVKSEPKIKSEPDPEAEEDEPDMRKAAKMRTPPQYRNFEKAKPLFIPGSDEPEPEAGPSGSSSHAVVVVSDDEDLRLPPLPWEVPTRIKSPSPAPSFAPLSPNEDPPTFFDDFHYSPSPPAAADTGAPGPHHRFSSAAFSAWAGAPLIANNGAEASSSLFPAPAPNPSVSASASASNPAPAASRFKKMGRGRG
ncbi:hypothetical protein B0H14DRAFT_2918680 [Mycena olivaceomarginata]|nr:hypothetical protein B0H14DRAFT_2918680 [Mycena olivaceomarginata]